MHFKKLLASTAIASALGFSSAANASILIGGDALNQAAATSILQIVFAIDTSGSMSDDIASIGAKAQSVIQNLSCPTTDCWVQARFFGINGTSGAVFNESLRAYVDARNGAALPTIDNTEDNGPAVVDLVNWYAWDPTLATASQNYFRAIVTIGDEGTDNGTPVNTADYQAAVAANTAAKAANIMLFSWVADDPVDPVRFGPLMQAMAIGGTQSFSGTTYNFQNTGGRYISGPLTDLTVEQQIEDIICFAASGGGQNTVPEPGSLALLGLGALGLAISRRRRQV